MTWGNAHRIRGISIFLLDVLLIVLSIVSAIYNNRFIENFRRRFSFHIMEFAGSRDYCVYNRGQYVSLRLGKHLAIAMGPILWDGEVTGLKRLKELPLARQPGELNGLFG